MTPTQSGTAVVAPEGLRIIEVSPVCAMGEFERCLLTVWRLQPTIDAFNMRHAALTELAARNPGKCAYVELIEPESKPPTDEMRKVAVEAFRKLGSDLSCVGFVLDGTQLRSALVRAILTGMTFLIPQMQPSKVFKRLGDAAEWIRPRIGQDAGFNPRLLGAFDYLRQA